MRLILGNNKKFINKITYLKIPSKLVVVSMVSKLHKVQFVCAIMIISIISPLVSSLNETETLNDDENPLAPDYTGARSTPPALSLSASSLALIYDLEMLAITPSNSGGTATHWAINPSLPTGLLFDTSNGSISGTPTVISSPINYTITATNPFGSDDVVIEISVVQQFPVIQYNPTTFTFNVGSQIFDGNGNPGITPNVIQGTGITWTASPSLPGGINLNSSTGVISGTPTVASSLATYQITAANPAGSMVTNLQIQVNDNLPSIAYNMSSIILTVSVPMTVVTPSSSGGNVLQWTITPSLPIGMTIDVATGEISGTPTYLSVQTTYVVTAVNNVGSNTTNIDITVNDEPPNSVAYSPHTHWLTKGTPMTPVTPTVAGGNVVDWSIYPNLPWGLSIDSITGEISGTPTFISASNTYTVYANNTGGTATATVIIAVTDVAPLFSYSPSSIIVETGVNITTLTPTLYGQGTVVSWSVSPNLPPGISLDSSTGVISGIPTTPAALTSYTITGTNSGGTDSSVIEIEVIAGTNPNTPSISLSSLNYTLIFDELMTGITPINSGVPATSWSISPSLPPGLVFYTNNGSIWDSNCSISTD